MKQTYRVLSGLIAVGVLVQAAAVAFGWFDVISQVDSGVVLDENFQGNAGHAVHGMLGLYGMPLLALLLLVVSFFAAGSVPGARAWAGIVLGLTVLQVVLAFVGFSAPIVGALHGLNALLLLLAAVRACTLTGVGPTAPTGAAVPRQRSRSASSPASSPVA